MAAPVTINIPHGLGLSEAKRRIGGGTHKLAELIPGGSLTSHYWEADDMHCVFEAMGQRIACVLQVRPDNVVGTFELPPMLALFANKIKEKLQREAPKLLK